MPGSEGCGADPFHIVPDSSKYVDQQQLKLQVQAMRAEPIKIAAVSGRHLASQLGWGACR